MGEWVSDLRNCKEIAKRTKLSPEVLRGKGRSALLVGVRRQFIRKAVLEEGYSAANVSEFLGCHASNISRALPGSGSGT